MKRLYEDAAYDTKAPIGSWWQASGVATLNFAPADKEINTEVAIIGAGYTGLNAGLQLAEKHGVEAIILEAAQPGWGASGRNGGFACLGGAALGTETQIKRYGMAATQNHMVRQLESIDLVAANLERYGIEADCHSDGELLLAHRRNGFTSILHEAEFYRDNFGISFEAIPKSAQPGRGIGGPEFHGAILSHAGFALNPLKYVQGLARAADKAGVRIFGNSPVINVQKKRGDFVLRTPHSIVRAKKLIVATNGYSSEDIPTALGARFLPLLSTIMVTRKISKDEQAAQGWTNDLMSYDSRHLLHYFRLMPDGRFLFGQRGAVKVTPKATQAAQRKNRQDFERMFPKWRHVETQHNWSGLVCLTRNLHQFVGPIDGLPGGFAALGYHGNGVAMASLCGRLVADFTVGQRPELPAVMTEQLRRFPLAGMRRMFIHGAFVKYQLQDRFF